MAIPLSNEMREVRAPRTANLRAIDAAPAIQQMGREVQSNMAALGRLGEAGINAYQRYDAAEDAFKRNEAERIYNERTTELNTQLAQKEGEERVKFQPKYEAEMKLASDTYEAAINKVHNFDIREGSKRSINAWNNRNASNYQYANYQNETNLQEKSMGQALISDNERRINSISSADTAKSLKMMADDPNLGFAHGEQMLRDFYKNRKGLPDEVVDQYVKDYKSKGTIAMANRLAQLTDRVNSNAAYNESLALINQGIQDGTINAEEGIEAKRTLETEKLDMIAATNPGVLFNGDGSYNFTVAHKYAPDLTRKELYKHISNAKNNDGSGTKGVVDEYAKAGMEEMYQLLKDVGYAEDEDMLPKDVRAAFADSVAGQDNASRRSLFGNVKALRFANLLSNGYVVVSPEGKARQLSDKDKPTELLQRGYKIVQKADSEELSKIRRNLLGKIVAEGQAGGFDVYTSSNWGVLSRKYNLTKDDKVTLDMLNKYISNFPKTNSNMFGKAGAAVSNIFKYGWNYKQTAPTVNYQEMEAIISATSTGLGKAASLYGVDPNSDSKGMDTEIDRMQWEKDKNGNQVAVKVEGAPKTTFGNEVANYTALELVNALPDEVFASLHDGKSKEQVQQEIKAYGGWQTDFQKDNGQESYRVFGTLSQVSNMITPEAIRPITSAISKAVAPSDQQLAQAVVDVKNFFKGNGQNVSAQSGATTSLSNVAARSGAAASLARVQLNENVYDERTKEFFSKFASENEGNAPLTFDQYILKQGTATPDVYRQYLSTRNSMLNSFSLLVGSGAMNKENPAKFFLVNDDEVQTRLYDEYTKQAIQYPSAYEDEFSVNEMANKSIQLSAPRKLFEAPKQISKPEGGYTGLENGSAIFLSRSGASFICKNGNVQMFDANPENLMNLVGMINSYQAKNGNIGSAQVQQQWYNAIPKKDLPTDWK